MSSPVLKANFAVQNKYEAFYTGGKVQFSKDGEHMFCQCGQTVQVLEVKTGRTLHAIGQEDDDTVSSFVLSPDNEIFVVASQNLLLRQWDWKEKAVTRTWKSVNTAPVSCMSFDCTSTLLACGSADSTVKVYDVLKQYYTHNLRGHQGVVSVAEFHPDITRLQLYSAADDYKILVWNLQTSTCIASLDSHYSIVTCLQFDVSAEALYSGGRDNVVHIWDTQKFVKKKTLPVYESVESLLLLPKPEEALNVTSEEPHFITAGSKGVLKVWNATSGNCVFNQQGPLSTDEEEEPSRKQSPIISANFVSALDALSVVTFDHNIILYHSEDLSLKKQFIGYNDDILDIKYIGEGDSHVAVATNSELIKVFEVTTWDCQVLSGHSDIVMSLDVCEKSSLLVSGSKDNTVRVWKMDPVTKTTRCVASGSGHTHAVGAVAFSRLSASFIASGSEDLTLKVWELPSKLEEDELPSSLHAKFTEKAHDKDINSIAVAPNDKVLATGSQDKTAKLWRVSDLSLLGVFRGHKRGIWCIQFSAVDQCLATASADGTIKIWALSDFSCVKTFEGHESSVLRVQFISQGMQLLSSGSDGLVKLWSIKTNECVKTLDEHEAKIWALAVDQKEQTLVTGAGDSNIILWKDVTEEEVEEKRAKQEDMILKEQELSNLLHKKKYLKAIGLAITLEQPFKVLNILKEILASGEEEGQEELEKTICKLRDDQIDAVVRFAVTWNTNSKHCHVAQFVLNILLRNYTPEDLLRFPNIKSSLEGLLPYTERHFQRMNRLLQQSTFVDYTWQSMKLVAGHSSIFDENEMDTTEAESCAQRATSGEKSVFVFDRAGDEKKAESSTSESESESSDDDSTDNKNNNKPPSKIDTLKASEEVGDGFESESSLESSSGSYDEIDSDDSDEINKEIYTKLLKDQSNSAHKGKQTPSFKQTQTTSPKKSPGPRRIGKSPLKDNNVGVVSTNEVGTPRQKQALKGKGNTKVEKTPLTPKSTSAVMQKKTPRTDPVKKRQALSSGTRSAKAKRQRRKSSL